MDEEYTSGDERLAEIRAADPWKLTREQNVAHRRELLAYVDELRRELDARVQGESADAAAGSYALRAETAEAERVRLAALVADYENRITWHTTCGQCATVLDKAIADHERAEQAVAERDQARNLARKALAEMGFGFDEANAEALELDTLPDWLTEGH